MEHGVTYPLTEWDTTVLLVPPSKMCVSECLCTDRKNLKKPVDKPDNCGSKYICNLLKIYMEKKKFKNAFLNTD